MLSTFLSYRKLVRLAIILDVTTDEIIEVRAFANVFWVRIKGRRPTFVSKLALSTLISHEEVCACFIGSVWQSDLAREHIFQKISDYHKFRRFAAKNRLTFTFDALGFYVDGFAFSTYHDRLAEELSHRQAARQQQILNRLREQMVG